MKTKVFITSTLLGMTLFLTSCGGDPKNSQEYKDLQAEMDKIKAADSTDAMQVEMYKKMNYDFIAGKTADVMAGLDDKYEDHNMDTMMTKKKGKEGMAEMMKMIIASNSDMKVSFTKVVSEGDMVYGFGKMSGKNTGDMGPMKATNKSYDVDFFDAIRYQNGKMIEHWGLFDNYAMMMQLGMMK